MCILLFDIKRMNFKMVAIIYLIKFLLYKKEIWSESANRSPLPLSVDVPYVDGYPSLANPELLDVLIETPGIKRSTKERYLSYLSFAPPEVMSHILSLFSTKGIIFNFVSSNQILEVVL